MTLGSPLLSTIRSAVEWLAYLNDSVTLLLSPMANVLNGDTECYFTYCHTVTESVKFHT